MLFGGCSEHTVPENCSHFPSRLSITWAPFTTERLTDTPKSDVVTALVMRAPTSPDKAGSGTKIAAKPDTFKVPTNIFRRADDEDDSFASLEPTSRANECSQLLSRIPFNSRHCRTKAPAEVTQKNDINRKTPLNILIGVEQTTKGLWFMFYGKCECCDGNKTANDVIRPKSGGPTYLIPLPPRQKIAE